ncbi:uncharacterized protein [Amphiura filiformis]|uniref:uncharacterized protein n=1 Tax=Amphiura filiformis TaxID=82378 RepID=UPI003B215FD4
MVIQWSPVGFVPGVKQLINAIAVVGVSESSADIRGTGLWKLSIYGSKNDDGAGEQFQRYDQMLSPSLQAQPLIASQSLDFLPNLNMTFLAFVGAKGLLDVSEIGCDREFRFVCFDFKKGDHAHPDFIFKSGQEDPSKVTSCSDSCNQQEGTAVVRRFGVSLEAVDAVEHAVEGPSDDAIEYFSLNVTIGASKASANINGTGLWKISIYGSHDSDGAGKKFLHVDQMLSGTQQAQPLLSGQNLTFTDLRGRFDHDAFGCDKTLRYVCFEFTKGDNPEPDFNFTSLQEDSSKLLVCSDTCEQEEGTAVARSIALNLSISELKSGENVSFTTNVTIGFSKASASINGSGLWKLTMYGSKHADCTGEKFQPIDQLLSETHQAQPVVSGKEVTFFDINGKFDFAAVGCDEEFGYLCFDFMKGDQPKPDFIFRSLNKNDTSRIYLCTDRCASLKDKLEMAVVQRLQSSIEATGILPGKKDQFTLNVTAIFSEVSIDVRGTGLWKLSMYGSKNNDGTGEQFDRIDQLLSRSQQDMPLVNGEALDFVHMKGELEISAIGCDKAFRYLCLDFAKGDRPTPDFSFMSLQSDGSKVTACYDRCPKQEETLMQTGFILVADLVGAIHVAPLDTLSGTLSFQSLPLGTLGIPVAVDFDPVHKKVYWTDVFFDAISRCSLDGSNKELVLDLGTGSTADGLAIDKVHRMLYWTDATLHTIEKANLDGTQRSVVLNSPKPRAIVVDSTNRRLFWTDWGDAPKIERANTDGTSRVTLVDTDLKWPNGLTIDYSGGRMYWCEAGLNRIESTDLNGMNRIVHLNTIVDIHPFGIGIFQDTILCSDWRFTKLLQVDVTSGHASLVGSSVFTRAGGMHVQNGFAPRTRRSKQQSDGPFAQCHDIVNPAEFFSHCTFDWCASQSMSRMCEDVAAYAKACQDHGVDVGNWREATVCENIAWR